MLISIPATSFRPSAMGATKKPTPTKGSPKDEASFDKIKQNIFARVSEIISSLPEKLARLNCICSELTVSSALDLQNGDDQPHTSKTGNKRKHEELDSADSSRSYRMRRVVAIERNCLLSDIDDLTIALNLLQLQSPSRWGGKYQHQNTEARQGSTQGWN